MKKVLRFLKRYHKKIILALIVVAFIILLAASIYFITLDDGTYKEGDMSSTPYAASVYTKDVKFTEDGIVFLYKHTDETTGEEIEEEKTSSEMAQIVWDEMIKAGSTVENYLSSVEELEKLMNAEIITQYPKLNTQVDLNGTIEFERHKSNGTSSMLEYIDEEIFNQYIENKNTDIVNYFTMDENENVLIGIVDENTETLTSNDSEMILSDYTDTLSEVNLKSTGTYSKTEYTVYSKPINYKSIVSKYTMPFQYLWSFIVIGDDKGVGLELADLVENSKIIISIYDNITTTVDTSTYTYNREKKVNVSATATAVTNYGTYTDSDSWKPADEWEEEYDYEVKDVITYKKNTPLVDVTKADVWIVDYSKEYTYQASTQTSQDTNEKDLEDTEYIDDGENPQTSSLGDGTDLPDYDHFEDNLDDLVEALEKQVADDVVLGEVNNVVVPLSITFSGITSCEASYYRHNVNRHEVDVTTISAQKYVAGNVVNNPKVEKKTQDEIKNGTGQNNFVTILCDANHQEAKRKITEEITSWLFELLEENPDTVNMIDLTKYLLYKVTGNDYGVTEYNFDEYGENNFIIIGANGNYGDWDGTGTQEDFINAVAPYAVIDMQQHNIYASVTIAQAIIESGWGKDSIAINYKNFFGMKAKGASNTGNEYWDGTGVSLNASEGGTSYFRVYDSLANSVYDHGRNFHVTATYSAHGVLDCMSQNLGPKEQLKRIALSGYAVNRDGSIAKPDGKHTYDEYLYENFIAKYNLTQYDTMTADDFELVGGKQDIVELAKSKIGSPYQLGASGPDAFDCSGFVYWVYGQKGVSVPRSTASYSSYIGSDREISWDEAQPGDILIVLASERGTTYGHAAIYLGNDQYIHAPKPGDSVKISNGAKSNFKHVFRF